MSNMTKNQAWHEAQRWWSMRGDFGSTAQVCLRTKKQLNRCVVGYLKYTDARQIHFKALIIGEGSTWEAAFANAEEREAQGMPPLREGVM